MSELITWRECIAGEMAEQNDPGPVVHCTLDDAGLDTRFDNGWGGTKGQPFTAWTERRVYFPACYDGAEWCASAPRDPSDEATCHVGGG